MMLLMPLLTYYIILFAY